MIWNIPFTASSFKCNAPRTQELILSYLSLENWISQTFKLSLIFKKRFVFFLLVCLLPHSLSWSFKDSCSHKSGDTHSRAEGLEKPNHCRTSSFKAEPIVTIDISIHLCRVTGNPLSLVFPSLQGAMLERANPWCEEIGKFSAWPMEAGIEWKSSIGRWLFVEAQHVEALCFLLTLCLLEILSVALQCHFF